METRPHESAFPEVLETPQFNTHTYGLTKREYFAAMAMQGQIAAISESGSFQETAISLIAYDAVRFADALISQLNKTTP